MSYENPCAQTCTTKGTFLNSELDLPIPEFPKKVFLPRAAMELRLTPSFETHSEF